MCLQCVVESYEVIPNVIPGYSLQIATNDKSEEWPKGHFGLVYCNDPDFVFPFKLTNHPYDDLSDSEFDNLSEEHSDEYFKWQDVIGQMREEYLVSDMVTSMRFIEACQKAGYSTEQDMNIVHWFVKHVGKQLDALQKNMSLEDQMAKFQSIPNTNLLQFSEIRRLVADIGGLVFRPMYECEKQQLMPVAEYMRKIESKEFKEYDGYCYLCKDGEVSGLSTYADEIASGKYKLPDWVTHIMLWEMGKK